MKFARPPLLFAKHVAAAFSATAVDFAVMILLVEIFAVKPAVATLAGALCGAVTNFSVGRVWVYRSTDARAPQAARYAVVSAMGAGWNALGEHVALAWLGAHYAAIRLVISFAVSLFWSYPMQRYVVFAPARRQAISLDLAPDPRD